METPTDRLPDEETELRAVIDRFLNERLQPKLDKLKADEDDKRQKLLDEHRPETWIADAARRVVRIQQATHIIKYSHPDAKGTSLISWGNEAAGKLSVGTHTLQGSGMLDTMFHGGAADMPVLTFLHLEVNGKSLLERATEADPALAAALPGDPEQNRAWMDAFAGLTQPKGKPASHKLAKQLYWPVGDDEYHLLAPLFPTTLVHKVWRTIREDRFSEDAKSARDAYRKRQSHPRGFREYPDFAIQKFGGTKPQNISQLNSERYGENYLLVSLPPAWQTQPTQPPLKIDSIFPHRFGRRKSVSQLARTLRDFLLGVRDYNNLAIRNKRAELVALIVDELIQFAAELQELPPGWSAHDDCRLNLEERCWLDPRRARGDAEFAAERLASDWRDAVCRRFANWLNARLSIDKTPMGDDEHRRWQADFDKELRGLREELSHD